MAITDFLFSAFLKCSTKCWLRAHNETPSGNAYAEWVLAQNESFRAAQIDRLLAETPPNESPRSPSPAELKAGKWRLAVEVGVAASWPAGGGSALPAEPTPSGTSGPPGGGTSERPQVPRSALGLPHWNALSTANTGHRGLVGHGLTEGLHVLQSVLAVDDDDPRVWQGPHAHVLVLPAGPVAVVSACRFRVGARSVRHA